ncbi:MAG: DUF2029 domain-containing protein [Bacteroidetes bacterium]|nr:DUF2029 domain-containing protein [Bacteroidota bacterium]
MKRLKKLVSNKKVIFLLFVVLALIASIQSLLSGTKSYFEGGTEYLVYNNYTIFKHSFFHLLEGKDLYAHYPSEHWDLFKYSPAFSVFFGLFAMFPDFIGLNLWNLLNSTIVFLSIFYLPRLSYTQKGLIAIVCIIELMTSLQNAQSNALIAGLIILSFGLLERNKYLFASLCIVFSIFIKLFGIVALAIFIFYPKKWKLALYTLGWSLVFFIMPLFIVDIYQFKFLYESWWNMLVSDHSASFGYSVMGIIQTWFNLEFNKIIVVLSGAAIFLLPMLRFQHYKNYSFRLSGMASVLLWVVIFNHKAESPTFVIAMAGVAIWFIYSKKSIINISLFILAILLTSLSPTDIFPRFIRNEYIHPYALKALPCILIWCKIITDMFLMKSEELSIKTFAPAQPELKEVKPG